MENKLTKSVFVFVLVCCNFMFLNAQESNPSSVENQKLMKNFLALVGSSSSYQNYKVIDKSKITNFQSSLDDFIKQEQGSKVALSSKLTESNKTIESLQNQISELQTANKTLLGNTQSIGFLGLSINKTAYSLVMWTLVLGAILFSAILFLKFKRANEITRSSKTVLRDLEDEYESFRRVCIQREQDLKRKLFDEIKKKGLRDAS